MNSIPHTHVRCVPVHALLLFGRCYTRNLSYALRATISMADAAVIDFAPFEGRRVSLNTKCLTFMVHTASEEKIDTTE